MEVVFKLNILFGVCLRAMSNDYPNSDIAIHSCFATLLGKFYEFISMLYLSMSKLILSSISIGNPIYINIIIFPGLLPSNLAYLIDFNISSSLSISFFLAIYNI